MSLSIVDRVRQLAAQGVATGDLDESIATLQTLIADVKAETARREASVEEPHPDPNDDSAPEPVEEAAEPVLEPVAAAAPKRPSLAALAAARPASGAPAPRTPAPRVEVRGERGTVFSALTDPALVTELVDAIRSRSGVPGVFKSRIAQAAVTSPPGRRLGSDAAANEAVVASAFAAGIENLAPIVASGGWCAPAQPIYSFDSFATAARPVKDSLPSFSAERGAVRVARATGLPSVPVGGPATPNAAVGVWTAATDGTPGESVKGKWSPGCKTITEIELEAIYTHIGVGTGRARAWPEEVGDILAAVVAAQARTAEVELLDAILDASVDVTEVAVLGASRDLLVACAQGASNLRWRWRLGDAPLRVILPRFALDMIVADVTRQQASGEVDALGVSESQVESWFRARGLRPVWALDGATGWTGPPELADGGNIGNWPTVVNVLIHPADAFLYLDGGVLDLGVYRDGALVGTNDCAIFAESFEAVAPVGPESCALHLAATVCANGESQVATDETAGVCSAS